MPRVLPRFINGFLPLARPVHNGPVAMEKPKSTVDNTLARDGTGIEGLDHLLGGGLPTSRLYLVKGMPGVGKTTLALQFLMDGARKGERVLYITLSETADEIHQVAESHGWTLDGVDVFELSSAEQTLRIEEENTLYSAEDVDLKETVRVLLDQVERLQPRRVVFDSLSEIRLLSQTPTRYRRQLLALKQYFAGCECTVMLLDDRSCENSDVQIESLAHGVISLEQLPMQYGADRRRLRITKLRGSPFRSGYHDFVVRKGGLVAFPRLIAAEHRTDLLAEPISSGIAELDQILGGGVDRSTCTLIMGPAGAGKSAIATQFATASARRGQPAAVFLFEERLGTWRKRGQLFRQRVDELASSGLLRVHQVDPAELAPDEFTHLVRNAVEGQDARVVVIDSITSYFTAMPEARFLSQQMHELLSYLSERGVASIMTMAQAGMIGQMTSPVDVSYLADTVILLRYFETRGRIRKALSVLKKRSGPHEETIRALTLDSDGVHVGAPLEKMHGVLTGSPIFVGDGRQDEAASQ
jgi:circadian clock protein KaiC